VISGISVLVPVKNCKEETGPELSWREILPFSVLLHNGVQIPIPLLHEHQHFVLGLSFAELVVKGSHHQAAVLQLLQENNLANEIISHLEALIGEVHDLERENSLACVEHLEQGKKKKNLANFF
jgi:hypothetical protein